MAHHPEIKDLAALLDAALKNTTAEASPDNPDPLSAVCDAVREACALAHQIKERHKNERAVIEAAFELANFRGPSLVRILEGHQYRHESEKVKALIDAVTVLGSMSGYDENRE